MFPLLILSGTTVRSAIVTVYSLCVIFLFSSSSIYHALKREEDEVSFWRKLDHSAIFFMIAGTYTAVCPLYLPPASALIVVSIQWALVLLGTFFRFFFLSAPRILYTAVYVVMGWTAAFLIRDLYRLMPLSAFLYLFAGGIAYTVGAVFYVLKRPRALFGFHEIFHLFILIGAFFHYLVIFEGLRL